ncbi:MAG: response regulator, partial [Gemmatimonadota bacterium]
MNDPHGGRDRLGPPAPATESTHEAVRALLIEDAAADADMICKALATSKIVRIEVERVRTLADGLARLATGRPDIVLLDPTLPDSDGLDAVRRVLEKAPGCTVIVLTGAEDAETAHGALRAGAHDYLVKDEFGGGDLERAIRYARERRSAAAALRASEERCRTIVDTAREGVWTLDPEGRTTFANQRLGEMLGVAPEALVGRLATEFFDSAHAEKFAEELRRGADAIPSEEEIRLRATDGRIVVVHVTSAPLRDEDGAYGGRLSMLTDVSQRRRVEDELERLAFYDPLTGLPNRSLFDNRLAHAMK